MSEPLKVRGVGRDAGDKTGRTIFVCFSRRPTDEELRELHDALDTKPHVTPPELDSGGSVIMTQLSER